MGVAAGHYAAKARPRYAGGTVTGESVEDAMVIGGATGAVVGAFIGGAASGQAPPQLPR